MNTTSQKNENVSLFDFNGHQVRVAAARGAPWFLAADTCRAIGLSDHNGGFGHHFRALATDEIASMADMEVKIAGVRGNQARLISESGLYKLVMRSDKPNAKAFQDWVTRTVLPYIRRMVATSSGRRT